MHAWTNSNMLELECELRKAELLEPYEYRLRHGLLDVQEPAEDQVLRAWLAARLVAFALRLDPVSGSNAITAGSRPSMAG